MPRAARRQPRPVDRSGRPEPDDRRQRRRSDDHVQRRHRPGRRWTTSRRRSSTASRPTTSFPYWVYGAQQDNSTVAIPSGRARATAIGRDRLARRRRRRERLDRRRPERPERSSTPASTAGRSRATTTGRGRSATSWRGRSSPTGHATTDLKYRFQWNAPIMISPNDPKALYHASQILLRTPRRGRDVGGDLARPDAQRQVEAGHARAGRSRSTSRASRSTARSSRSAESPAEPGVIWAGSDDGLVHVTRDDGKTWQNVTPKGMPEWIQINAIDASPRDEGHAPTSRRRCTSATTSAPTSTRRPTTARPGRRSSAGSPTAPSRASSARTPCGPGCSTPGPRLGLYVSFDDGASWQPFQRNLPGRSDHRPRGQERRPRRRHAGPRVLDPRRPDRSAEVERQVAAGADAYLFPPRPAVRMDVEARDEEDDEVADGRTEHAGRRRRRLLAEGRAARRREGHARVLRRRHAAALVLEPEAGPRSRI